MSKVQAAQLLARGIQDAWLSGEPQVSFYRSNFKRHAPFALTTERFLVPIDGKIVLNPKSDLLGYTYLTAHDIATGALVPNPIWTNIISTVELVIGNQKIATHDLTYINTIQKVLEAETYSKRSSTLAFQPLGFFFDRQALPIAALKYSDVKINITWVSSSVATQYVYKCWSHCIHLGEDERLFFATQRHQMLIPQIQRIPVSNEPLFRGPLKYLAAPCLNYPAIYYGPFGGNTVVVIGGYRIHTFSTVGTSAFVSEIPINVEVLVVAGGGGGGGCGSNQTGGGGGGGELIYRSSITVNGTTTVTVGAGGTRGIGSTSTSGTNGGNSIFGSLTALGGGFGGNRNSVGNPGGSGGGGGRTRAGGASTATVGLGNAGGSSGGSVPLETASGGGGGGAMSVGQNASDNNTRTPGGNGYTSSISGTSVVYAAGGKGGARDLNSNGENGTANRGNGGGGGDGNSNTNGGTGGSGIVIVRYRYPL